MSELKKLLKNRNNRIMLLILIIGIIILMLSAVFENSDSRDNSDKSEHIGEEARLSEILSEIRGAGEVSVMISYERDYNTSGGIGRGIGYSEKESEMKPRGVIGVADGADIPEVRSSLKAAAAAVTGVGANRVCVYDRDTKK